MEKLLQQQTAARSKLAQAMQVENEQALAKLITFSVRYTIVRQAEGGAVTLDASETSLLQPGDLVKATLIETAPGQPEQPTDLASSQ